MTPIHTIDAHVEGDPLRLVVGGFPAPKGATMREKRRWAARYAERTRRMLMCEPRAHVDMRGAVLTEPVSPGSDAGLLFMDGNGFPTMSGRGVIATTTIALERHLIGPASGDLTVVYDTPAGTIRARGVARSGAADAGLRIASVSFLNVPSFVVRCGATVKLASRTIRADVAFGGVFYAIVDSEAAGLGLHAAHIPELRRTGIEITRAIESADHIVHPYDPRVQGVYGVVFTGPAGSEGVHLRNVTISAGVQVARSPSGTATAAVMAVLDAMGLLTQGEEFVDEGLIGTRLRGRIDARVQIGTTEAIIPEIEGSAWITGEHTFVLDASDPFPDGFCL